MSGIGFLFKFYLSKGVFMKSVINLCRTFDKLSKKVLAAELDLGKKGGRNRKPLKAEDDENKSKIDFMVKAIANEIDETLDLKNKGLYVKDWVSNQSGYLRSRPLITISKKKKLKLSEKEMYISISFDRGGVVIKYTEGFEKFQNENKISKEDALLFLRRAAEFYFEKNDIKAKNNFFRDHQSIDILRKNIPLMDMESLVNDIEFILEIYKKQKDDIYQYIAQPFSVSLSPEVFKEGKDLPVLGKRRSGQADFRRALKELWGGCSVTGCTEESLLVASHIKPWAKSNPKEKTDLMNGLLLTPNYNALFDKFLISFDGKGKILISNILRKEDLERTSINLNATINLNKEQKVFMKYHRNKFYGGKDI